MTFPELRREVQLLLRFHAGTLKMLKNDTDYLVGVAECIGDLSETLRAYVAERSIRREIERLQAQQKPVRVKDGMISIPVGANRFYEPASPPDDPFGDTFEEDST